MKRLNIESLTAEELSELLQKAGGTAITPESIRADIAAGLPLNLDGKISLSSYVIWLLQQK